MEIVQDLIKIGLPSGIVLYGLYLIVKTFMGQQFQAQLANIKRDNNNTTLPLRLQAYERMCIFLERISPNSLIIRLNDNTYTALQFQHLLITEIREEFHHNLSQQLYMSNDAWAQVVSAKEQVVALINESAKEVERDSKSLELAKKIFEKSVSQEVDSIGNALKFIKEEARQLF